jgi:hypothetical protein
VTETERRVLLTVYRHGVVLTGEIPSCGEFVEAHRRLIRLRLIKEMSRRGEMVTWLTVNGLGAVERLGLKDRELDESFG